MSSGTRIPSRGPDSWSPIPSRPARSTIACGVRRTRSSERVIVSPFSSILVPPPLRLRRHPSSASGPLRVPFGLGSHRAWGILPSAGSPPPLGGHERPRCPASNATASLPLDEVSLTPWVPAVPLVVAARTAPPPPSDPHYRDDEAHHAPARIATICASWSPPELTASASIATSHSSHAVTMIPTTNNTIVPVVFLAYHALAARRRPACGTEACLGFAQLRSPLSALSAPRACTTRARTCRRPRPRAHRASPGARSAPPRRAAISSDHRLSSAPSASLITLARPGSPILARFRSCHPRYARAEPFAASVPIRHRRLLLFFPRVFPTAVRPSFATSYGGLRTLPSSPRHSVGDILGSTLGAPRLDVWLDPPGWRPAGAQMPAAPHPAALRFVEETERLGRLADRLRDDLVRDLVGRPSVLHAGDCDRQIEISLKRERYTLGLFVHSPRKPRSVPVATGTLGPSDVRSAGFTGAASMHASIVDCPVLISRSAPRFRPAAVRPRLRFAIRGSAPSAHHHSASNRHACFGVAPVWTYSRTLFTSAAVQSAGADISIVQRPETRGAARFSRLLLTPVVSSEGSATLDGPAAERSDTRGRWPDFARAPPGGAREWIRPRRGRCYGPRAVTVLRLDGDWGGYGAYCIRARAVTPRGRSGRSMACWARGSAPTSDRWARRPAPTAGSWAHHSAPTPDGWGRVPAPIGSGARRQLGPIFDPNWARQSVPTSFSSSADAACYHRGSLHRCFCDGLCCSSGVRPRLGGGRLRPPLRARSPRPRRGAARRSAGLRVRGAAACGRMPAPPLRAPRRRRSLR